MPTLTELEATEAKMNSAKEALLRYVEAGTSLDRDRYRQLVARVKKAEAEFMEAVTRTQE
jgi:hypothetical protein